MRRPQFVYVTCVICFAIHRKVCRQLPGSLTSPSISNTRPSPSFETVVRDAPVCGCQAISLTASRWWYFVTHSKDPVWTSHVATLPLESAVASRCENKIDENAHAVTVAFSSWKPLKWSTCSLPLFISGTIFFQIMTVLLRPIIASVGKSSESSYA